MFEPTAQVRFWSKVAKGAPFACWHWTDNPTRDGYGRIAIGTKRFLAHRVAFMIANGREPIGGVVRHTCDNPTCCNPAHLIEGTHADNVRDRCVRGRTHNRPNCPHGHALSGPNLFVSRRGYRVCRTCERNRRSTRKDHS